MDTKKSVLKKLEKSKGRPVSGSVIAMNLGISRTAVWKAICALRKEGHEIEGGSGRGYVLSEKSDKLSREGIETDLKYDIEVLYLESVDSTNKEAMRRALDEPTKTALIVSNNQTQGKGRLGRSFYSPPDTGIYMSFLFRPKFDVSKSVIVTAASATAVCRSIEKVTGIKCSIKWVNDIYSRGQKVSGILTEAVSGFETGAIEYLIVGIGINCTTVNFPKEAGDFPGSLGSPFPRNALIAEIANTFLPMLENMSPDVFIDYYRDHSLVIGKNIKVFPTGKYEDEESQGIDAFVTGISSDGGLMVRYPSGKEDVLRSGEITVRPLDRW